MKLVIVVLALLITVPAFVWRRLSLQQRKHDVHQAITRLMWQRYAALLDQTSYSKMMLAVPQVINICQTVNATNALLVIISLGTISVAQTR